MCDALREALGDRFGLDDRQTRPQVVTLYAQALERAFPEIYTHVTPLVSRREAKMAREVIAQQKAARGVKKASPKAKKAVDPKENRRPDAAEKASRSKR